MKHKHKFHFTKIRTIHTMNVVNDIYEEVIFVCECGQLKTVKVKE